MMRTKYKHKSGLVFMILPAFTAEVIEYQSDKKIVFIPKLIIYEGHEITVTSIGERSFYNSKISSVKFEQGSKVERIKQDAFNFSEINDIIIPSSVQKISLNAFSHCHKLTKVHFEQDSELNTIGPGAFSFCSSLESFEFPKNVTEIGSSAFSNCPKLNNLFFSKDSKLTSIEVGVFSSTNIKKLTITSSLKNIYKNFGVCSNLSELIIYGKNIELTSDYFIQMKKIQKVRLPTVRNFCIDENCGTFEIYFPRNVISSGKGLQEHETCYIQKEIEQLDSQINNSKRQKRQKSSFKEQSVQTSLNEPTFKTQSTQTYCDSLSIDELKRKIFDLERQLRKKEEENELLKKKLANEKTQKQFEEIKSFEILSVDEFDQLEIGKQIGRGATSFVIKVFKKEEYALKCLNTDIVKNKFYNQNQNETNEQYIDIDKIRLFIKEYEILNQMNNVNIVKTYGFFAGDKTRKPSILLEYCPINLKKFIELGDYSPNDIAFIVIQICHAMKYIHAKGIIHRDIKPENILLNSDNVVKLGDFGISKLVSIEEQNTYSNIAGTFNYMAPELLNNVGKYDFKVDVYSFGIVLYFMLTRKLPEISLGDFLSGNKVQTPFSLNSFSKQLIECCCARDPNKRPSFENIIIEIKNINYQVTDNIDGQLVKTKLKKLYRRE